MMRSVRRREFQESFDRYIQVVERRLQLQQAKLKKNIWPPFRLPGYDSTSLDEARAQQQQEQAASAAAAAVPNSRLLLDEFDLAREIEDRERLDRELDARWRLLNTKLIHALFLTILYEVL